MKRFWLPITIGIVVILGFAIWVQFSKKTNCFAKWAFDFLMQWAIVLTANEYMRKSIYVIPYSNNI